MNLLLEKSLKALKEAAAKGALTWQGKKVILDPFLPLGFYFEITPVSDALFSLTAHITCGTRVEVADKYDVLTPLGALQGGTFRLWENPDHFEEVPPTVTAKELERLIKEGLSHRFKGEKTRLKPAPLPLLKLSDRTGGFASLYLDYGAWGEVAFHDHVPTQEEQHWESDLLETGFKKKMTDGAHYFCPLDQVGKSIAFLLEMGWKVFDCRGKRVVKQQGVTCQAEEVSDAIILKGTARFGEKEIPIQDVVGTFERHERWIDLSSHEVGLIELPPAWEPLLDEERVKDGIRVRKIDIGLLHEIVPSYMPAEWQEVYPGEAFQGRLFPYQQKGLSWLSFLARAGFSGLLADEMGLGKTIQVLAFLSCHPGRTLIVMPVTLISLWKQQLQTFLPGVNFYVHQGSERGEALGDHSIILTSYSTLRADLSLFMQEEFETIILDEAQMIKNSTTQIAQALFKLKSRFRLALTGTPIENRVEEIHSLFRFLIPTLTNPTPKKLRPFILRRTKQEVGLDLPEKIVQVIGVDPSEEEFRLYEELLRTKRTELMQKMEVLELILRLRQLSCHPALLDPSYAGQARKFTQVLTDLEEVVSSNCKVLVYSQFTTVLGLFEKAFQERGWSYVYLDGSTRDRETPVLKFQNDPTVLIFLMSLKAGGVGLNLQAADYVFLYDPWWNSAAESQAIDRAHRVGRKETVIARKYYTTQTIEAKILTLQSKKSALAEALWEEESTALSFEAMIDLL